MITELEPREREIFRQIVEIYSLSGEPVGSRTVARRLATKEKKLSAATVRNIMADLQEGGLIYSPHTSAGRIPTEFGLRLFINGILEVETLSDGECTAIRELCLSYRYRPLSEVLSEISALLADLTSCVGFIAVSKQDRPLKYIDFLQIDEEHILVILVTQNDEVENRIMGIPEGFSRSILEKAKDFLNAHLVNHMPTLQELYQIVTKKIEEQRTEIDTLTAKIVEMGLATRCERYDREQLLIVRGQSKLLGNVTAIEDIERIKILFEAFETHDTVQRLLNAVGQAKGVRIFIGKENILFNQTGYSLILSAYRDCRTRMTGTVGVIGLQRLNYARIIPMVDYTAKTISQMITHSQHYTFVQKGEKKITYDAT